MTADEERRCVNGIDRERERRGVEEEKGEKKAARRELLLPLLLSSR